MHKRYLKTFLSHSHAANMSTAEAVMFDGDVLQHPTIPVVKGDEHEEEGHDEEGDHAATHVWKGGGKKMNT